MGKLQGELLFDTRAPPRHGHPLVRHTGHLKNIGILLVAVGGTR
jgi:hypothetical protein